MRTCGRCYALLVGKLYYIEPEVNYIIRKLSVECPKWLYARKNLRLNVDACSGS